MMKLVVGLVATVALMLGSILLIPEKQKAVSSATSEAKVQSLELPAQPVLAASNAELKLFQASKTITLEEANTVVMRGPVTSKSVSELQIKIEQLRQNLADNEVIYLVMDTPGGSVIAGMDFIDYLKALPNKVQTVTLFAASMGWQIVQNMDQRYITETGTLMSHRASGGVEGQFDGELESQYKMIKRKIDYLDTISAKRIGKSLADYKALIKDEYWVSGFDSVDEKAADEKVNLRCGKSMTGTTSMTFSTFLGPIEVEFSRCPLIRAPLAVSLSRISQENQNEAKALMDKALNHQRDFVKDYISTNTFDRYFK